MEHIFLELGVVIISAAVLAVIGYFLRQPLIIAYIFAGILIGPSGLGLVTDVEVLHIIAEVGIMLLLFLVGLEMNPARLKELGVVSLVGGIGQVVFTFVAGYFLALLLGFAPVVSVYLSIGLTFSSTVIAVKIMNDQSDNNSLYGQITIGILLVQDVLAIIALLMLSGFTIGTFQFDYLALLLIIGKGVILGLLTVLVARKILIYVYEQIASSHELLILFSLAWAFLITIISQSIGFSAEIGAFIAGLSLASLPYTYEINAKARVLRDFFVTIFFVALGASLVFTSVGSYIPHLTALSLLVVIGNPLIMLLLMGLMGYDKRTAFFTGLAIANISEFSLFIFAKGLSLGHLSEEIVSMGTIIGIGTMTISSYMMVYNNQLYAWLKPYLGIFELRKNKKEKQRPVATSWQNHLVLLGCDHMGRQILDQVLEFKEQYIVVDQNSVVVKELQREKINAIFGDVSDDDFLREINLADAEMVISTLPNLEDNLFVLRYIRRMAKKQPVVVVTSHSAREGILLFNNGADYVIVKAYLGGTHVLELNRELYALQQQTGKSINSASHLMKKPFKSDHDYAQILHQLNRMRLKEIKENFRKGESS